MAQLKDYVIVQPKSKIKAGEGLNEGKYKFFTSSNAQTKWLNQYQYDKPALIFGTGGMASVHFCDTPFSTSTDCIVMYAKGNLNLEYVYRYLESHMYILENGFKGVGLKHISKEYILSISIPEVDPLQQESLIATTRKVDEIIYARQNQLTKLDELVKSRFIEMFGFLEEPTKEFPKDILKNLCKKITDGKHGGCTLEMGTGRYFVGAREIYNDTVHYDTAPEINVSEFEKDYKRCNVEIGDFLIVNTGATIGKSAITVDPRTECTLLQKSVALLKVKREVLNPVFLQYCYKVNDTMYRVESASAQPNLLLSKINSTEIYVPSMEEQNQFAVFAKHTNKLKFEVENSLEKFKIMKNAIMQQYFG